MRKKLGIALIAGAAGLMIALSGCAGQETEAETVVETSSEEETQTSAETESQETESSENESVTIMTDMVEGEGLSGVGASGIDPSVPVHIWGTVSSVGEEGITVDNQSDNSSKGEILLTIDPEKTLILGAADGLPVEPADIELGSFEAYLGPAMTMSLPPQTTPYAVIVNIPQDSRAPLYVVAFDSLQDTDSGRLLVANDGTEYTVSDDTEVVPYLTRNIVSLEDIKENSRMLLWLNEDEKVEKIMLFAE